MFAAAKTVKDSERARLTIRDCELENNMRLAVPTAKFKREAFERGVASKAYCAGSRGPFSDFIQDTHLSLGHVLCNDLDEYPNLV